MAAPKLKDLFDERLVRELADELSRGDSSIDKVRFIELATRGLEQLELMQRAWHIAEAMHACLPTPFASAAHTLVASLGPELAATGDVGALSLRYMPHVFFVQKYGLEDFESAMHAQYELTKRFSAEFSIRPFLVRYPDATYARLEAWASDANVHVRRLVSEGTRPRLPWAPRLRAFQDDPQPVLALLERLKDDSERYVQRSVANSLNDVAKDHPDLVIEVCRRWMLDARPGRTWIVKHALRSLVKKGEQGALSIIGASGTPSVAVDLVELEPREVKLGGELRFAFSITSTVKQSQDLLVDYVVHFKKASGETRPKVFKLRRVELGAMDRIELRGAVSFAKMTTRRHYTGRHGLDAMINGVVYPLGSFEVR